MSWRPGDHHDGVGNLKLICIVIGTLMLFSSSVQAAKVHTPYDDLPDYNSPSLAVGPVPYIPYGDLAVRELFNSYRIVAVLKFCNKMTELSDKNLKDAEGILLIKEIPFKVHGSLVPFKNDATLDQLFGYAFESLKGFRINDAICEAAFHQFLEDPALTIDGQVVITRSSK
jgi:hypothetical protein